MYQSHIYSCVCQCSSVFCPPQLPAHLVPLPGSVATVACLVRCARQPKRGQVLCQHPVVMVAQQAAYARRNTKSQYGAGFRSCRALLLSAHA